MCNKLIKKNNELEETWDVTASGPSCVLTLCMSGRGADGRTDGLTETKAARNLFGMTHLQARREAGTLTLPWALPQVHCGQSFVLCTNTRRSWAELPSGTDTYRRAATHTAVIRAQNITHVYLSQRCRLHTCHCSCDVLRWTYTALRYWILIHDS
jgi:hypothetical protein